LAHAAAIQEVVERAVFCKPVKWIVSRDSSNLAVHGSVTLDGTLQVSVINGFRPMLNQVFVIVNNDGTDPLSGTFAGLPEGAEVSTSDG
jgi:hypothetical protein